MNAETPETNSHLADTPETDALLVKIARNQNTPEYDYEELANHACKIERELSELAGYLCRVKLPLPVQLAARLAKLPPGENV